MREEKLFEIIAVKPPHIFRPDKEMTDITESVHLDSAAHAVRADKHLLPFTGIGKAGNICLAGTVVFDLYRKTEISEVGLRQNLVAAALAARNGDGCRQA